MTNNASAPISLRNEVWCFFAAILVLNAAFVVSVGEGLIPQHLFPKGRLVLLGGTLVVVVFLLRGFGAVLELIRPVLVWRVKPHWFLAAILVPIVFSALFVIARALLLGEPIVIFGSGLKVLTRPGFPLNLFIVALVGEIVWVGYAIRNLSKFYSLQTAAAITGTFWGLWWLPMVIYSIGITPGLPLTGLWMNMLGIAFFCAFFYTATGSGLVILGMQIAFNSSILAFPVLPNVSSPTTYLVYSALYMILGFLTLTFLLPRLQRQHVAAAAT